METSEEKSPPLFLYALFFLVVWVGLRILQSLVLPGSGLSLVTYVAIVALVVWLTSWHFAKSFRRHFTNSEQWKLVLYCSFWIFLQELLVLYAYFNESVDERDMGVGGILFVVLMATVIDAFILWVGFTRLSKVIIAAYIRKDSRAVA